MAGYWFYFHSQLIFLKEISVKKLKSVKDSTSGYLHSKFGNDRGFPIVKVIYCFSYEVLDCGWMRRSIKLVKIHYLNEIGSFGIDAFFRINLSRTNDVAKRCWWLNESKEIGDTFHRATILSALKISMLYGTDMDQWCLMSQVLIIWNLKSSHEGNLFQFEVGSDSPIKRARNSLFVDSLASNHSEAGICSTRQNHVANFIHDEYVKDRESETICLLPGIGVVYGGNGSKSTLNSTSWKTRICKKWGLTGCCPFGSKCLFAHGSAELQPYGRGNVYIRVKDLSDFDTKLMTPPSAKASPVTRGAAYDFCSSFFSYWSSITNRA